MSGKRFNSYKIMWILVFFDLPTYTKKERKAASDFRNSLLEDGFTMFQFSIYMRHCASRENMEVHKKRIKNFLPREGKVGMLTVTDKQFGLMDIFISHQKRESLNPTISQLELF